MHLSMPAMGQPSAATPQEQKKSEIATLKENAAAEDPAAQLQLGFFYYWGTSVTADYDEAEKWYLMAAIHENTAAQQGLARVYQRRSRDKHDQTEAFFWYSLCAKNWKPYAGCEQVYPSCPDGRDVMRKYLSDEQVSAAEKRVEEWKPPAAPVPEK